jgi:phosphatidylglycerol:prolipoprotein diacylglycerol transferase
LWNSKRTTLPNGLLTAWFLIILFSLRFVDEFFKINQTPFEDNLVLNMGQILSIPFVIAGIVILVMVTKKGGAATVPTAASEAQGQSLK